MRKTLKNRIKLFLSKSLFMFSGGSINTINQPDKWISNYYRIGSILKKFYNISFEIYFLYLDQLVNKYDSNSYEWNEIKRTWLSCFIKASDAERMFIYQMMYFTGVFDSDIARNLVKFAQDTKIPKYRYWLTMDLGVMTFRYQDAIYKGYFTQRKELLNTIAKENVNSQPVIIEKNVGQVKKICIVTYMLSADELNSVRRVTASIANGLSECGAEINIVNFNAFFVGEKEILSINPLPFDESEKDKISREFDKQVKITHIYDKDFSDRLNKALKEIYKFNPDIILDISDEYSPISSIYSHDFCTIYMTLRSMGTSSYFYKLLIGGGKEAYKIQNEQYNFIDMCDVVDWNLPEYIPNRKKMIAKCQVVEDTSAFIIVTIGNNDFYINQELADKMAKLLFSEKHVVWLLVGRNAPQYMHKTYRKLFEENRIIEWGFEEDLLSLCSICDVSLRPDMKGGSGGTALAAKAGIPIVLTRYKCDPMRWLGQDYSNNNTYDDCITEIENLINNKEYYDYKKEKTLACINSALDVPEKWQELLTLLNKLKHQYCTERNGMYEKEHKDKHNI